MRPAQACWPVPERHRVQCRDKTHPGRDHYNPRAGPPKRRRPRLSVMNAAASFEIVLGSQTEMGEESIYVGAVDDLTQVARGELAEDAEGQFAGAGVEGPDDVDRILDEVD